MKYDGSSRREGEEEGIDLHVRRVEEGREADYTQEKY